MIARRLMDTWPESVAALQQFGHPAQLSSNKLARSSFARASARFALLLARVSPLSFVVDGRERARRE